MEQVKQRRRTQIVCGGVLFANVVHLKRLTVSLIASADTRSAQKRRGRFLYVFRKRPLFFHMLFIVAANVRLFRGCGLSVYHALAKERCVPFFAIARARISCGPVCGTSPG